MSLREQADAALQRAAERVRRFGPGDGRFVPSSLAPLEDRLGAEDPGPLIAGKAILGRFKRLRK